MRTHEKAAALKRAELKLQSLEVEEESLREQIAASERRRSQVREELQRQRALLQRLTGPGKLHLTEHALLRYIERVLGVRVEAQELVPPEAIELWRELGDGKYPVGSPVVYWLVIRGGRVVTIEVS